MGYAGRLRTCRRAEEAQLSPHGKREHPVVEINLAQLFTIIGTCVKILSINL